MQNYQMRLPAHESWRTRLARDLGWWSIIKLGLLALLWGLFFSGTHQCRVDGTTTASRFGLTGRSSDFLPTTTSGGGCD
jgi:hypothetical protein